MPPKPDNYLVWSILVTLFCCLPFGVVAIVKSCAVDSAYNSGNLELAQAEAAAAKRWCLIGACIGAVTGFLYIGVAVLAGLFSH